MKKYLFVSLAALFLMNTLSGCLFFVKELEEPATLVITPEFQVVDRSTSAQAKYIGNQSFESLGESYMSNLNSTIGDYNIRLADFGTPADYEILIQEIALTESESEHTVNDEDSEFHGQVYMLTECDVSVHITLYKGTDRSEVVKSTILDADKEEKVKNNRTLGDLISGSNQDNNTHRHKLLSDDIFADLSAKCGRNTSAWISKQIGKDRK